MIYKTRKRYRGEPICADPTADPRENETALHFTAGELIVQSKSRLPVGQRENSGDKRATSRKKPLKKAHRSRAQKQNRRAGRTRPR